MKSRIHSSSLGRFTTQQEASKLLNYICPSVIEEYFKTVESLEEEAVVEVIIPTDGGVQAAFVGVGYLFSQSTYDGIGITPTSYQWPYLT